MDRNRSSTLFDIEKDDLLTTEELAAKLNVAVKTIRHWRYAQQLPAIKLGPKLVRYRLKDVLGWLSSHGG